MLLFGGVRAQYNIRLKNKSVQVRSSEHRSFSKDGKRQ